MKRRYAVMSIIFCAWVLFPGCYGVDNNFRSVRNVTLKECGKNFVTDEEFALGSFEMWLAGLVVGMAVDDEVAEEIIDNVSGVQVGIYKRRDNRDVNMKSLFKKIDRQMLRRDMHYLVKSYRNNEMEAVYVNDNEEKMFRELFVVQINNIELTIVQVRGDLEKVIEAAIREEGLNGNWGGGGVAHR